MGRHEGTMVRDATVSEEVASNPSDEERIAGEIPSDEERIAGESPADRDGLIEYVELSAVEKVSFCVANALSQLKDDDVTNVDAIKGLLGTAAAYMLMTASPTDQRPAWMGACLEALEIAERSRLDGLTTDLAAMAEV